MIASHMENKMSLNLDLSLIKAKFLTRAAKVQFLCKVKGTSTNMADKYRASLKLMLNGAVVQKAATSETDSQLVLDRYGEVTEILLYSWLLEAKDVRDPD